MGIETASLEKHFKSQNIDYYVNYLTVSLTPLKDFLWGGGGLTGNFAHPKTWFTAIKYQLLSEFLDWNTLNLIALYTFDVKMLLQVNIRKIIYLYSLFKEENPPS